MVKYAYSILFTFWEDRKMKKILTLMMSLVVALTLTACSGDSGISGTYELVQMKYNGIVVNPGDALWEQATGGKSATITLNNDGSCSADIYGQTGEGTYKEDGSTVTITIDGDALDFTINDDQLTAENSGVTMVFEK